MNLIRQAIQNFHKGPLTTLFGFVFLIGSVLAFALEKVTWDQALEGLGLSVLFFSLPDPNKKDKAAILIGIALMAVSCTKPASVTTNTKTEVKTRDTTLAGDKVSATVDDNVLQLLNKLLSEGKEPKIIYRNTPSSPTNLTISLDSLGRTKCDCVTDPQVLKDAIKEYFTNTETQKTIVKEVVPQWVVVTLVVLIVLVFLLLFILFIQIKRLPK